MKNVIISNPEKFEEKKKKFLQGGASRFHVLADFDKTLTPAFFGGNKLQSLIAILRNKNYLSSNYANQAHALFEKYHPIEIDPKVSVKEKKKMMNEWWREHFNLLIKSGLNLNDLNELLDKGDIQLRQGVLEFVDFLYNHKVPLVIISASGVGDIIPMYLEREKRLYENVHIVTNLFEWGENGNAVSIKQPIIHSMNKDETTLESLPIYTDLKERKNVLLLGDGLGDLEMIKGFKYDNLISIGFLNEKVNENIENFKKHFDVILIGDGDFSFVNNLVKEIMH